MQSKGGRLRIIIGRGLAAWQPERSFVSEHVWRTIGEDFGESVQRLAGPPRHVREGRHRRNQRSGSSRAPVTCLLHKIGRQERTDDGYAIDRAGWWFRWQGSAFIQSIEQAAQLKPVWGVPPDRLQLLRDAIGILA